MLFLPDVYHNSVMRATLQDHNKHFTDSAFNSLTADEVEKEIISVIEHEVWGENDTSFIIVLVTTVMILLELAYGLVGLIVKMVHFW